MNVIDRLRVAADEGVPANGWESRIELPRPIAGEDFVLALDLSPFTERPVQRVTVAANGEMMHQTTIGGRQVLRCPLHRRVLDKTETLKLTLLHPDGAPAASMVRPLDRRVLSVMLHGLTLTPTSVDLAITKAATEASAGSTAETSG